MTMRTYDFADPDEFRTCLQLFLAEHPMLAVESQAVAAPMGVDQVWLSTEGMVEFFDWARAKCYISSAEAQWAITKMRDMANVQHNQRQRAIE